MRRFGIDTSRHQGNFDFAKAMQEHNVEYAILKIGGADDGLYMDSQFENSYNKCVKAGLPKGVYFFGHAMNMEEAKKEADYLIGLLKGRQFEYPIFYDVEADMLTLDKNTLTEICLYVLRTVQTAGYWVGIYTSDSHFEYNVDDTKLKGFSHWVASYSATEPVLESGSQLQMWQFGGTLNLIRSNKINGQTVDQNYCYVDYPTLIKAKGLNGLVKEQPKKEEPKPQVKLPSVEVVAKEVWAGKWGTNPQRQSKLTEAYGAEFAKAVQDKVDELYGPKPVSKPTPIQPTSTIQKGDKVTVVNAINYDDGQPFAKYYDKYDVLEVDGNRAVIGIGDATTSAIDVKNIKKV